MPHIRTEKGVKHLVYKSTEEFWKDHPDEPVIHWKDIPKAHMGHYDIGDMSYLKGRWVETVDGYVAEIIDVRKHKSVSGDRWRIWIPGRPKGTFLWETQNLVFHARTYFPTKRHYEFVRRLEYILDTRGNVTMEDVLTTYQLIFWDRVARLKKKARDTFGWIWSNGFSGTTPLWIN